MRQQSSDDFDDASDVPHLEEGPGDQGQISTERRFFAEPPLSRRRTVSFISFHLDTHIGECSMPTVQYNDDPS